MPVPLLMGMEIGRTFSEQMQFAEKAENIHVDEPCNLSLNTRRRMVGQTQRQLSPAPALGDLPAFSTVLDFAFPFLA